MPVNRLENIPFGRNHRTNRIPTIEHEIIHGIVGERVHHGHGQEFTIYLYGYCEMFLSEVFRNQE